jgi:hypothetical protein
MRDGVQVSADTSGSQSTNERGTKSGGVASVGTFAIVHPAVGHLPEALPTSAAGPDFSVGMCVVVHPAVGVPLALGRLPSIGDKEGEEFLRGCVQVSPDTSGSQCTAGDKEGEQSMRGCVHVSPDTSGSQFTNEQGIKFGGVLSVGMCAVVHPAFCHLSEALPTSAAGPVSSVGAELGGCAVLGKRCSTRRSLGVYPCCLRGQGHQRWRRAAGRRRRLRLGQPPPRPEAETAAWSCCLGQLVSFNRGPGWAARGGHHCGPCW